MYKVTGRWPHQDSVKVEWNLGKRCNYDCAYCPAEIHDNVSPHTDIEILKATVDRLVAIGKPIRLSFTGGEPTVHPRFAELLEYCRTAGISWISVTTNGTRRADWYLAQPVDQWVYSIHFEQEYWRVIDTVIQVHGSWTGGIVVNVMAQHDNMTAVKSTSTEFKSAGIPHGIRRVRWTDGDHDIFDDSRYLPDDLEWIKNQESTVKPNCIIDGVQMYHANDIIKLHLNKYRGWQCAAGIESLMINWDGEVYRATCRVGGSQGNIYSSTFILPSQTVVCDRNWCTCAADIPLSKQLS